MKISYRNRSVEKQFASEYATKWKYPEQVKLKLIAIENYIKRAKNLQDIINYKPYHFHQLQGKRKGECSIYVGNTGYRVTMIPVNEDEKAVTSEIYERSALITGIEITEVSNHYE